MDREEARELLLGYSRFINEETDLWEALDLAIGALEGDLHCPKCGTIVRDGRQYHDLVYRKEMTLEEWQELDRAIQGDAESATTTDCNYTCSDCKHQGKTYEQEPCHSCFNNDGAGYEPDTDCISRAEQVTSKLKNPCDSLLKSDPDECKEQKSKLDCISRADVIAYIDRLINSGLGKNKSLDYIRKYISALPPVTPTERTGEWCRVSADKYIQHAYHFFRCSECGADTIGEPNFCPNCGAMMTKGGDE